MKWFSGYGPKDDWNFSWPGQKLIFFFFNFVEEKKMIHQIEFCSFIFHPLIFSLAAQES